MLSSIQIHNSIAETTERRNKLSDQFNTAEGDERAAIHDAICEANGRIDALNDQLADALKEEERVRDAGGVPLVATHEQPKPMNVAQAYLGTREQFADAGGIKLGVKVNVSRAFADTGAPTFGLPTPERVDTTLPENVIDMPMGVIDTLAKGTTDADLKFFVPGEFTNAAADWAPGSTKAKSDETWTEDSAQMFWTAHHVPISRDATSNYGQLESIIRNDLMSGLRMKHASDVLLHTGSSKEGILKKAGIQEFAIGTAGAKKGESFYDSVRRAAYASWRATGIHPDYVAVHPMALLELDLQKLSDGQYMNLVINNKIWGIPVVEDINLESTTGQDSSAVTKYGALVYNHNAATWYTAEADALTIGLVNDQFIRNEYTLLAEGKHAITVTRPKSFVHIANALGNLA